MRKINLFIRVLNKQLKIIQELLTKNYNQNAAVLIKPLEIGFNLFLVKFMFLKFVLYD